MEFLTKPEFIWLIAAIVFFAVEALTLNYTTLWFGFSSLLAMIISAFGGNLSIQIIAFVVCSLLLILFLRPVTVKFIKKVSTNLKKFVGKQAIVTEKIDNHSNTGKIKINGEVWPARSDSSFVIKEREVVEIVKVSNNMLFVKMKGM